LKALFVGSILSILLIPGVAAAETEFRTVTDPMTDAKRGVAVINPQGKIIPVVKCDKNGPNSVYISIVSRAYLGEGAYDTRPVKFRFDSGVPFDINADYEDFAASFLNLDTVPAQRQLLFQLKASKSVVIQLTDFEGDLITEVVSLTGATAVIEKAVTTCGDTTFNNID
jgi:hypothetical protein